MADRFENRTSAGDGQYGKALYDGKRVRGFPDAGVRRRARQYRRRVSQAPWQKEGAQTKAYMKALRTSIISLYDVSDIVPGQVTYGA
ncbi:hypothetical protein GCM10007880_63060 [Mesorhizobium amorphae]|uniref:hypothetical protein n=1 Tax=Mesorhizobium amorphae TaxID=71433 RepID=UPI00235DBCAC|nr:hypothetical protein [Mesorhizobium amorphae]GLR45788.1 hypothetical protein GCM10007880_63060 [Mesorhizobium amorphae]